MRQDAHLVLQGVCSVRWEPSSALTLVLKVTTYQSTGLGVNNVSHPVGNAVLTRRSALNAILPVPTLIYIKTAALVAVPIRHTQIHSISVNHAKVPAFSVTHQPIVLPVSRTTLFILR